jgi:hypothetical protein
MRSATLIVRQIALVAVGLALVGGLIGGLVAQFATSHGFLNGIPYGMVCTGLVVAFITAQSGSPSRMAREGRWGYVGNYYGRNAALPRTPAQFLFGGLLAFGVGLLALTLH